MENIVITQGRRGCLTGPTMAYFVGEGCHYTKNIGKYQQRLAVFALISWLPFIWFDYGCLPFYFEQGRLMFIPVQSVIFSLFLGLTAIRLWESEKVGKVIKINTWFQFGVILVPLMLHFLYNGQGGSKARIHKWFFYPFYPAHLFVLGLLRWVVFK